LTDAGRRLLASASASARDELQRRMSAALSTDDLRRLGTMLAALRAEHARLGSPARSSS
jgi:hypothetical protein